MTLKRFSLFYLVSYLVPTGIMLLAAPTGIMLLAAPDLAFKLFFSNANGAYGDVAPRMVGALCLALGIIVINIIVKRVEDLYPALIIARVMLVSVWVGLYAYTSDPFFLFVAGVVGFGLVLTIAGIVVDRQRKLH
jgi:hypothetical protein